MSGIDRNALHAANRSIVRAALPVCVGAPRSLQKSACAVARAHRRRRDGTGNGGKNPPPRVLENHVLIGPRGPSHWRSAMAVPAARGTISPKGKEKEDADFV